MEGSRERVMAVLEGRKPDRTPLYELIRNDGVIEHFTGRRLTIENAPELIFETFPRAVDCTRGVRMPDHEGERRLEDGRLQKTYRWTVWTERPSAPSSVEYAETKREALEGPQDVWTDANQERMDRQLAGMRETRRKLGDDFFFFGGVPALGLMGMYGEFGLEPFCYYLADCPEVMDMQLENHMVRSILWAEHLPDDHGIVAAMSGDDIAFKGGPLLSPAWFDEHYMPRLKPIMDAYHTRGIKVNFHSDGDLMPVMDGLVEAGIDMLNPIETAAGMDIAEMHRRYPKLVYGGGIDVSALLPFGTPTEVRDATVKAIDDSEGQILIGSSTELQYTVPLANFMAMREAAMAYAF